MKKLSLVLPLKTESSAEQVLKNAIDKSAECY
jgi:hypothetical protein